TFYKATLKGTQEHIQNTNCTALTLGYTERTTHSVMHATGNDSYFPQCCDQWAIK
ncbi:mCG1038758, isoform CRA_b, partial [Mus musculus]